MGNYEPVKVSETLPIVFDTEALKLIGPGNQKFYHVENGAAIAGSKKYSRARTAPDLSQKNPQLRFLIVDEAGAAGPKRNPGSQVCVSQLCLCLIKENS